MLTDLDQARLDAGVGRVRAEMASGLAHPARVVGFHFFNPVTMMPLVEVVGAVHPDDAPLATALAGITEKVTGSRFRL